MSVDEDYGSTEYWKDIKQAGKEKRRTNLEWSIQALNEHGITYTQLSSTHLRVHHWDYWPSTGLFIHTKTKARGRGVFKLIDKVVKECPTL